MHTPLPSQSYLTAEYLPTTDLLNLDLAVPVLGPQPPARRPVENVLQLGMQNHQ